MYLMLDATISSAKSITFAGPASSVATTFLRCDANVVHELYTAAFCVIDDHRGSEDDPIARKFFWMCIWKCRENFYFSRK